ncbi:hypothetical protein E2320_010241 [Naja naja]|nr:hypothetical protein E2320_010241 [Naja naja]
MEGLGGKGLASPIQQTILEGLEKGEFGLEDVEGLEAFPVQVQMDAQLNPQRIWKPVPLIFDFHYKQQALARGTAQIIPDQIYGSGQFTAVDQQKDLPDEAYPIIILAVFAALSKVEGKEGGKSFATIKQQNGENYGTFIDRLKLAIERQINNPQAQEELLLKLAVENANVDCKRLLTPLVASGSALDLAQLLEAAAKAGSNVYNMECMATAFRDGNKKTGNCFNCGKPGHFKAQCRAPEVVRKAKMGARIDNQA